MITSGEPRGLKSVFQYFGPQGESCLSCSPVETQIGALGYQAIGRCSYQEMLMRPHDATKRWEMEKMVLTRC
jgi:hypothetical protein